MFRNLVGSQNLKRPMGQHRHITITPTELTEKRTGLRQRICGTSHKQPHKIIRCPGFLHFICLIWQDNLFSPADNALVSTGVCCFYYRPCRLKRPLLKPVQHVIKFCKHKEYNEQIVQINPRYRKMMIPTSHQGIQHLCIFLLTHSLTKRKNLLCSCSNYCTCRISTELV